MYLEIEIVWLWVPRDEKQKWKLKTKQVFNY